MSENTNKKLNGGNGAKDIILIIVMIPVLFILCRLFAGLQLKKPENLSEGFSGDTSACRIYDDYGLLSKDEIKELDSAIKQCSEKIKMNIAVYLPGQGNRANTDRRNELIASEICFEKFGKYTDSVVYYLDISGKSPAYDYIYTEGRAMLCYNKNVDAIFNTLDGYLPKSGMKVEPEQIHNAVLAFCRELEYFEAHCSTSIRNFVHDKDFEKNVYVYTVKGETYITESEAPGSRFYRLLIAAGIGYLTAIIFYFVTRHRYIFKNATNPKIYVANKKTRFNVKTDELIRTYVTKHAKQSSSGGSRGGHGGGSFHSHGGGHHR